jgi:predicted ribosome quality control (RQC) complex YloA/Tae2 family protein
MQPVDFTTLTAIRTELSADWIPAKIEQVYQRDRYTIALALRTLQERGWLTICWHPQAARINMGDAPPRIPDTFTFSEQLRHQLNGLALIDIRAIAPWERVLDLQFAKRPGEEPIWHLYVEIIGKYSNVILTDADDRIVTVAHQVTSSQSSVRTVETGQPYRLPPALMGNTPKSNESLASWRERVSLIPGSIKRQLLQNYRGLSPSVANSIIEAARLDPEQSHQSFEENDWQILFQRWQEWIDIVEREQFQPGWTNNGYTVLGWGIIQPTKNTQELINSYYTDRTEGEIFLQLRHQLIQKLNNILKKLTQKAQTFENRLKQSDRADLERQQADLLMAHLHEWQPGMKSITLADFETNEPVTIALNPEKNAIQNAQLLYKTHQKLKRAKIAVEPLLQEVRSELNYLEQIYADVKELANYRNSEDLQALSEIREELIQQKYLESDRQRNLNFNDESKPHRYTTPSGFELWIGRNNRQNEQLTFRLAGNYDLWFHTQEIPGSHVLLRLQPGTVPDRADLQFAADFSAYYSQARQSDIAPVVYTEPKHVYKPKGAKPGTAIYKQERIIWGRPQIAKNYLNSQM